MNKCKATKIEQTIWYSFNYGFYGRSRTINDMMGVVVLYMGMLLLILSFEMYHHTGAMEEKRKRANLHLDSSDSDASASDSDEGASDSDSSDSDDTKKKKKKEEKTIARRKLSANSDMGGPRSRLLTE